MLAARRPGRPRSATWGFGQAQLAGDQAGEQGVAEGSEGLSLLFIRFQHLEEHADFS